MKTLLATAALATFGCFALVSANAGENPAAAPAHLPAAAVAPASAPDATATARVAMTFNLRRDAEPATLAPAPTMKAPAVRPAAVAGGASWYGRDPSLQRGDVVVTETGALVYEGEKSGKRHFRTVARSRLVSRAERDQILAGLRR